MSRFAIIGLILSSVFLNALAQILLRIGARAAASDPDGLPTVATIGLALRPSVLAGLACYGVSLLLWLHVLGRTEVSFAYPFLAVGFALVAVAGWQLLGEPMPPGRIAGIGVILAGVLMLARS